MYDPIDVFFVGPGKCGTTWLFEALRRHPEVAVPRVKETAILDDPPSVRATKAAGLWQAGPRVKAEFSNTYAARADIPEKVAAHNPNARIVITVRDPRDRARSHINFLKRNGEVPKSVPLEKYLATYGAAGWVARSCDYRAIYARFRARFPYAQILVLPLENLRHDPQAYLDRLTGFLQIAPLLVPEDLRVAVLPAQEPRSVHLAKAAKAVAQRLRRFGWLGVLGWLKRQFWMQTLLFRPLGSQSEVVDHPVLSRFARDYPAFVREFAP